MTRAERLAAQQFYTRVAEWKQDAFEHMRHFDSAAASAERKYYLGQHVALVHVLEELNTLWPDLADEPPDL